jgi:pimeloyl-ACP methyl ester carboxylesterase
METSAPAHPQARPGPAVLTRPGARLAYQVSGDGPAVVLVHGFGLDQRMWDAQAEHLSARYQVVRYDCRGFGASGPFDPAVAYTHAGEPATDPP